MAKAGMLQSLMAAIGAAFSGRVGLRTPETRVFLVFLHGLPSPCGYGSVRFRWVRNCLLAG